jgi:hypothetical protein
VNNERAASKMAKAHAPESCICPRCKKVMSLSGVPALRSLDLTEFYFECDNCDYASAQVTTMSSELICTMITDADIHHPSMSDAIARCELELAGLRRASGAM